MKTYVKIECLGLCPWWIFYQLCLVMNDMFPVLKKIVNFCWYISGRIWIIIIIAMEEPYFWFKWQELFKNKTMKTWIITKDGDLWVINSKYCTSRWWYKLFYDAWKIVSDNLFIWSPSASKHCRESLILLFPSHLPIECKLFDSLRHILRM